MDTNNIQLDDNVLIINNNPLSKGLVKECFKELLLHRGNFAGTIVAILHNEDEIRYLVAFHDSGKLLQSQFFTVYYFIDYPRQSRYNNLYCSNYIDKYLNLVGSWYRKDDLVKIETTDNTIASLDHNIALNSEDKNLNTCNSLNENKDKTLQPLDLRSLSTQYLIKEVERLKDENHNLWVDRANMLQKIATIEEEKSQWEKEREIFYNITDTLSRLRK